MPRRYIIPKQEVLRRRALEWEHHYNNRRIVTETFVVYDPFRVINTINRNVPAPIMRADGSLLEGLATVRGRSTAADLLNIDQSQKELMCLWYWSDDGWADFNGQYQNLPEVTEDYCLKYDEELDAAWVVPVSQKPHDRPGAQSGYVSEEYEEVPPRKSRYKSGTTRVQVG